MSESEMASRLITKVPADYPPIARAAHIEGNVVIKAIVGTDGSVVQAQIISGHPMLSREALLSVSKWRYQPVLHDGSPVEVATTVTVEFKLSDQPQTIKTAGAGSATSAADSQAASAETIQLTNGRTIHADSISDAGEKIEYTIGDSTYKISKSSVKSSSLKSSSVKSMSHAAGPPAPPSSSAVSTASPAPAETIQLTDGRIIHADSITYSSQKIEYTLGGLIYEVPRSLIKSIVHAPSAKPAGRCLYGVGRLKTSHRYRHGNHSLEDADCIWRRSEELVSAGINRAVAGRMPNRRVRHPLPSRDADRTSFPNNDDAQRICAILSGNADDEYERQVDRGVELERTLCYTPGYVPKAHSSDPKIATMEDELNQISADFGKRMIDFQQNPHTARTPGLRLMLDMYRLSGKCGH